MAEKPKKIFVLSMEDNILVFLMYKNFPQIN